MDRDEDFWARLLACPACRGALEIAAGSASCAACGLTFRRLGEDVFDLLPPHLVERLGEGWSGRQVEMEGWYRDLAAEPGRMVGCFNSDYSPFRGRLASLSGTVLDLGGGNGVVRHFLPEGVVYVAVDPSLEWLGAGWGRAAAWFPCLATPPRFVRGVGESLPLRDESFDAVLAFWSLNHVERPAEVFREVARVLRPGGTFLAVLEDMEPRWADLLAAPLVGGGPTRPLALIAEKARRSLRRRPWALQSDHLRIPESDLRAWGRGSFAVDDRSWVGQYLTYEFRRETRR